MNVHRALQARDGGLSRGSGRPSSYDALTDLKRCSLVCRFWANRCRQYMFAGRTLEIYRSEDAEIFRRYAIGGCAALIPVHHLIGEIHVYLRYDGLINSFLHLLYLSVIRQKLRLLSIHGPYSNRLSPCEARYTSLGITTIRSPSTLISAEPNSCLSYPPAFDLSCL